ncbi:ankyrin-1-like [Dreissena polymorpha]|nr:ankyrin-1-like [Dreissena polymorpha]
MDAAMYMAVQNNEPTTLRQLIDSGADVNEYYQDMTLISAKSILHMCCEKGRYDCVKVLLERGANLYIRDTWYQTPLMYCMITQYDDIAALLLQHDPGIVDIGDKYGKSAMHIAVDVGSIDCLKVLLRYGADVNVRNDYGVTPLIHVCGNKSLEVDVMLEMVRLLVESGADPNLKCYREARTALQCAMIIKHVEVVETLLSAGSDPNVLDNGGRCPITTLLWYHRATGNDVDDDVMIICILLIQSGASLNLCRFEHSNALCMATLYGYSKLVEYFLNNGAHQNAGFYCGVTPLQIATRHKDTRMMKILLQWPSDLYRKGRVIRGELDYNSDVFHLAIDIGAFEVAILLADSGYNVTRVKYFTDWSQAPPSSFNSEPVMLDYFRQRACSVQSLFILTMFAIRKSMPGNITESARDLPLPKSLIGAIQLENVLT